MSVVLCPGHLVLLFILLRPGEYIGDFRLGKFPTQSCICASRQLMVVQDGCGISQEGREPEGVPEQAADGAAAGRVQQHRGPAQGVQDQQGQQRPHRRSRDCPAAQGAPPPAPRLPHLHRQAQSALVRALHSVRTSDRVSPSSVWSKHCIYRHAMGAASVAALSSRHMPHQRG